MRFLECLKSAGKVLHGHCYLWSMMKKSSVSRMQRFMYSQILCYVCLGMVIQNPTSNIVWEEQLGWFKDSSQYRNFDRIDGEPMDFEWNIFPGFTTLQLVDEVQKFTSTMEQDVGHSSDLGQKQSGVLFTLFHHELMMIKFRESGHPVFRASSPLSRGTLKSKGGGKLSLHLCADGDTIETVFLTIISVNQLSIYGAVSDLCDEHRACQARMGRPVLA